MLLVYEIIIRNENKINICIIKIVNILVLYNKNCVRYVISYSVICQNIALLVNQIKKNCTKCIARIRAFKLSQIFLQKSVLSLSCL